MLLCGAEGAPMDVIAATNPKCLDFTCATSILVFLHVDFNLR